MHGENNNENLAADYSDRIARGLWRWDGPYYDGCSQHYYLYAADGTLLAVSKTTNVSDATFIPARYASGHI